MNPEPPPHYNRGAVTIPGRRGEPFRPMLQFSVRPHCAADVIGAIGLVLCLLAIVTASAAAQTIPATGSVTVVQSAQDLAPRMSWVTVIWSMNASACLTLAVIYFLVWYRNRRSWAHLFFSVTAASTAGYAFCELLMMRAATPRSCSPR